MTDGFAAGIGRCVPSTKSSYSSSSSLRPISSLCSSDFWCSCGKSYTTGLSVEAIIEQQNASSGMWAFGELLETIFLVILFYLLWPICFNAASRLPRLWAGSKR